MPKLNQVIAIEKGIKSRVCAKISELHKLSQKPDLFNGFIKTYEKKDDEGEDYPQEKKKVQMKTEDFLTGLSTSMTELFDISYTRDVANCTALADIKIGDTVLIPSAPLPFILFMEKQINDIRTFIEALPILDEAEDWWSDNNSGLYKTVAIPTHKTKKIQRPIILSEATKEHPAQTQLISEDVTVGYWKTVKNSGGMPLQRKKIILEKIEELSKAVKFAREKANSEEATMHHVGFSIFSYLIG